MTTAELEKLFLDTAEDMRFLLGYEINLAVLADGTAIFLEGGRWLWQAAVGSAWGIPPSLALAALTECWRDKLEKEFGVEFPKYAGRWLPRRQGEVLRYDDWVGVAPGLLARDCGMSWDTFPKALCGAIRALAKEKRQAEAEAKALSASRAVPINSDPALRAARRIRDFQNRQLYEITCIIAEELAKETPSPGGR